jgi:hypothetical protein
MLAINGIESSAFTDPIAAKTQEEGDFLSEPNLKHRAFQTLCQMDGDNIYNI